MEKVRHEGLCASVENTRPTAAQSTGQVLVLIAPPTKALVEAVDSFEVAPVNRRVRGLQLRTRLEMGPGVEPIPSAQALQSRPFPLPKTSKKRLVQSSGSQEMGRLVGTQKATRPRLGDPRTATLCVHAEAVAKGDAISVSKYQDRTARGPYGQVAHSRQPKTMIRLVNVNESKGVDFFKALDNLARCRRGAIVGDDDLEVLEVGNSVPF